MTHRQLIAENNKRIVGRALRRTNYAWAKVIRSMHDAGAGVRDGQVRQLHITFYSINQSSINQILFAKMKSYIQLLLI